MSEWLVEGAGNRKAFEDLLEALRPTGTGAFPTGSALALVGAGSSARVRYPLWGSLLDRMATTIGENDPTAEAKLAALKAEQDMLWRAEEYRSLLGPDLYTSFIRTTFGPEEAPHDTFHEDLVRLPFRHILTTNYDAVLEQAHTAAFHRPRAVAVTWTEAANLREIIQRIGDPTYGRRYIYLHGRFDAPEGIVLTERDYTERYVRHAETWPRLFALLAAQRVVSLGFSLSDLDLMGVFREVKALMGPGDPRHFAILPHEGKAESGSVRQRLQGKYGIRPVFYRQTPTHEGLPALVKALLMALTPSRPSLPPDPPTTSLRPPPEPLPPRAGYDPQCYVRQPLVERRVLSGLAEAGSPVVLLGSARSGKTALLRHVLDDAVRTDQAAGKQSRSVLVELSTFDPEAQVSHEDFLYELAMRLVEGVEGNEAWLEDAWGRPGTAARRLTWLLKTHLLNTVTERLLVAIESADQLPRFGFWEHFLGLLRSWAQESKPPWDRLRIAIAVSTEPTLLKEEIHRSPFFNAAMLVRLQELDEAQVVELTALYRLRWSDADRRALVELVGGHPYLLRLALHEAALHGTAIARIVEAAQQDGGIYRDFLGQLRRKLDGELRGALCRVLAGQVDRLDPEIEDRLRGAGLIRGTYGAYRLRYPLYEAYFRHMCAQP
ncbi:AAA-like domain-containing protein [Chondromyces apiculatus]|uniref:Uncharacterized protein n=1 Tax=Chondromyces apiculatus DSM 436 TaxID=1192034 RepID=A0A017THW5_9BACT|nr:AAA-like domain-containing protein [Chondromyces apiculatus]EYF08196.1 Hypothetical protein CAP_5956 [Chondromyces apiculatus DSM 436]